MALSVRVFGLSSWSILAPQAVEGVLAVWPWSRRYGTARSSAAGLLAGAAWRLTPVAVLMFRFDNPDAMLVLLLVASGLRDPARDRVRRPAPGPWLPSPAPWSAWRSSPR